MKVLLANKYFYLKGGAEGSFFETVRLLERRGHAVVHFSMAHERNLPSRYAPYFVSSVDYERPGLVRGLRAAGRLLYSFEARRNLGRLLADERPDVVHLNNIYHQLSPSILHALRARGVPVVMTLRDYKMVCGSYLLLAHGRICEACRGGRHYQCLVKACVKGSRAKSLLTTMEMYLHQTMLKIYDLVDVFISPSRFLKDKLGEMGFRHPVVHLPNCVNLEDFTPRYDWARPTLIYFGRLSSEKGLLTLLRAAEGVEGVTVRLIGEGPLRPRLEQEIAARALAHVELSGYLAGAALREAVREAWSVVLPSECYENNPRTIIEGFALGKPAIASRIGGIPELVHDGRTGLTFPAGDAEALRAAIRRLRSMPQEEVMAMGRRGRAMVEERLNEDVHYAQLMDIYRTAIDRRRPNATANANH